MRLANITAIELSRDSADGPAQAPECRAVAYVAEQTDPVYISEPRRPEAAGGRAIARFGAVSFEASPLSRSFRLALQLWTRTGETWRREDEWIVDLRNVRRRRGAQHEPLVIHTRDGPMVPAAPVPDRLPSPSKHTSASSDAGTLSDSRPPSQKLSFRLFGWSNDSAASDSRGAPLPVESEPGLLVSASYPMLVDLWTLQHSLDDAQAASSVLSLEINRIFPESILPLRDQEASRGGGRGGAPPPAPEHPEHPPSRAVEDSRAIAREQSRLASQLLDIFPIDPVQGAKFYFTIRGLALPSVFAINHYDPVQVGAALGFVAQVVVLLSQYLDVALPYPITVYGSQSVIADNISSIKHGSNKFPLWTRGALLYRVEYALYLLHKDIEQLMNAVDLAVADLKQTLANLKNLLLVVSHRQV